VTNPSRPDGLVILGHVSGRYGVKGWVKVYSDTRPREDILRYRPWLLKTAKGWQEYPLKAGRPHGKGIVAQLAGVTDRDQAGLLTGAEIAIRQEQLPALATGEFYWMQLEGLQVENLSGVSLGTVSHLFETGANDVMVVEGDRQRLIPYIDTVVKQVDLTQGIICVDWDAEF